MSDKIKNNKKENVVPIRYKSSKLEKTLKMSNEETLAKAIRELLLKDKI